MYFMSLENPRVICINPNKYTWNWREIEWIAGSFVFDRQCTFDLEENDQGGVDKVRVYCKFCIDYFWKSMTWD